jgi:hypothetical protein
LQEGASLPGLQTSVNRFVKFSMSEQAVQTGLPALLPGSSDVSPTNDRLSPLLVNATLKEVPAALALPVIAHKPLYGAIKVTLHFESPASSAISSFVQLCAVNAHELANLKSWVPPLGTSNEFLDGVTEATCNLVSVLYY